MQPDFRNTDNYVQPQALPAVPLISKNPRQKKNIWLAVLLGALVLVVISTALMSSNIFVKPWSDAIGQQIPVKKITVGPMDHTSDWGNAGVVNNVDAGISSPIVGAQGHWLSYSGPNVPKGTPGYLWYDGHMVASAPDIENYILSANGMHYAFTQGSDNDYGAGTIQQSLIIDGRSYLKGTDLQSLRLSNDGTTIYYTCTHCNGSSGLFSNDHLIIGGQEVTSNNGTVFDGLSAGTCLYDPKSNVSDILSKATTYADSNTSTFACSPNGKHIITSTNHAVFVGSSQTVKVDGHKVGEGLSSSEAVDDSGQPSYLLSNGGGRGRLVIRGKNYSFSGYTSNAGPVFSTSSQHAAMVIENKADTVSQWWLDGRDTGYSSHDTISLDDTGLYVYEP